MPLVLISLAVLIIGIILKIREYLYEETKVYTTDDIRFTYKNSEVIPMIGKDTSLFYIPVAICDESASTDTIHSLLMYMIVQEGKNFSLRKLKSKTEIKEKNLALISSYYTGNKNRATELVLEFHSHMINFVCDSSKNPHAGATLYTSELRHKQDPENNDLIIKKNELL